MIFLSLEEIIYGTRSLRSFFLFLRLWGWAGSRIFLSAVTPAIGQFRRIRAIVQRNDPLQARIPRSLDDGSMLVHMKANPTTWESDRLWRDDDFYVARPDDRATVLEKTKELVRAYPLVRTCALIFLLAFSIRTAYNLYLGNYSITPELRDMYEYDQVARSIVDGSGYRRQWAFTDDRGQTVVEMRITMFRPPLYPLALSASYGLTNKNPLAARIVLSVVGASTAVLALLLARSLFGTGPGVVAGVLVALYPPLVAADGVLYPESLFAALVTGVMLLVRLLEERPTLWRSLSLGLACGAVALTRPEGMAWAVLPVAALAVSSRWNGSRAGKLVCLGIAAVFLGLAYLPWLHHTWSNFRTVAPSTSLGSMVVGANNRAAYYDPLFIGTWYYGSVIQDRETLFEVRDPRHNEKTVDDLFLARGIHYAGTHLERLPTVVGARLLRAVGLWDPNVAARLEEGWGRPRWVTFVSVPSFLGLATAAVTAMWRRRDRWRELLPLALTVCGFLITSVAAFATSRFRVVAEPALAVGAAPAIYSLLRRRSVGLRTTTGVVGEGAAGPGESEPRLPPEVERAIRMREERERRRARMTTEHLASLHEGEDLGALATGTGPTERSAEPVTSSADRDIVLTERATLDLEEGTLDIDLRRHPETTKEDNGATDSS